MWMGLCAPRSASPRCVCVDILTPQRRACVPAHSIVSDYATPWTVAHQAPLSIEILQARILERVAVPCCPLYLYYLLKIFLCDEKCKGTQGFGGHRHS